MINIAKINAGKGNWRDVGKFLVLAFAIFLAVQVIINYMDHFEQATQTETTQQAESSEPDWVEESFGLRYAKCDVCGRYGIPMRRVEVNTPHVGPRRWVETKVEWHKANACEYCTGEKAPEQGTVKDGGWTTPDDATE